MVEVNPLVSVIVTTKNEEKHIEHCLKSIKQQTYSQNKIEIIVVDNKSSDTTKKIARKFTRKIFDKSPERSAQRNFGINKAHGKYILFLDADMMLSPQVINECIDKFASLHVGKFNLVGLYIPEIILGDSFWSKVRNFERSFYNATVIDCIRFFPKKVWEEVEGFDEDLTGPEDWDFDKRVRKSGKTDIINQPLYHNEADFILRDYLKGKSYYARTFDKYVDKWGRNDPDIKKQFGFCYRYFGIFIENRKWVKLFSHPILAFGLYFLRIRVGFSFFWNKIFL